MSAILDKSLDEIVSANKKNTNHNNRRRARHSAGAVTTPKAPSGGVQKNSKPAKQNQQKAQAKPQPQQQKAAPKNSDSKVIVNNLPKDVTEQQIKEYFNQTVGPIKKVIIAYGPNSQSRGIAEVIFSRADGATKAAGLNGLLVDGRPIKIEIVVSSDLAARALPAPKSLADRATLPKNPKNQPKSTANDKRQEKKSKDAKANNQSNANVTNKTTANGHNNRRRSRTTRPKKTEAELDSEMADYYNQAPAVPIAATLSPIVAPIATPANDIAMDDNIM